MIQEYKELLLKEITPRQKEEWGDYDRCMLENIVNDENCPLSSEQISWLKSLCPQSHWKPSEIHLEALGTLLGCLKIKDEQRRKVIEDLFEQLKAL